jgi:hypothetical protein
MPGVAAGLGAVETDPLLACVLEGCLGRGCIGRPFTFTIGGGGGGGGAGGAGGCPDTDVDTDIDEPALGVLANIPGA